MSDNNLEYEKDESSEICDVEGHRESLFVCTREVSIESNWRLYSYIGEKTLCLSSFNINYNYLMSEQ